MSQKYGVFLKVAGLAGLFALFVLCAPARAQSPTQDLADCITDSWGEYLECLDDLPWWVEMLCASRFTSDVVLCAPKIVLDGVKKEEE